ncbi:hypothetical protein KOW79_016784, partial [Hemibagrus wyckioides]
VAEALIMRHPCLQEKGSATGYGGWKTSLKHKLSNYRTHLRKVDCPEVCVNALVHKPDGKCCPAFAIKKPKRGEVAYCPSFPLGESYQSLKKMRAELLSDIKKRNNRETVRSKMEKTFALRRKEIICDAPMIAEVQERWPALFNVMESNAEFKRITTMSLQFQSQLDLHSADLLRVSAKRSGQQGKKLKNMSAMMTVYCEFNRVVEKRLREDLFDALDHLSSGLLDIFRKEKGLVAQLLSELLHQTKDVADKDASYA